MAYVSVHVDLSDVYDDLDSSEKQELVEWLVEDGYTVISSSTKTPTNPDFDIICDRLAKSYYRLSKEDEETIINLSKKYGYY